MYKCMDVHIDTKTVIPCSLQSIAAAQSRRLTTIHDTENFSVLSPAKSEQKNTAAVIFYITELSPRLLSLTLKCSAVRKEGELEKQGAQEVCPTHNASHLQQTHRANVTH